MGGSLEGAPEADRIVVERIVSIGDNCIDVYLDSPSGAAIGGNALNVAVDLARLGVASEYIGAIGDDANGRQVRVALERSGVRATRLHVLPGRTWIAYIRLGRDGIAVVEREDPGAAGPYVPSPEDFEALTPGHHAHLANLADPAAVLTELARRGVSASYDYGASGRGHAAAPAYIAFFSYGAQDLARGAERTARDAVSSGARVAVVTMGAQGSLAFDGTRTLTVPAEPIDPVDTLGAGDSYIAAFLAQLLSGASLAAAMHVASRAAAETCRHWAAWSQERLPVLDAEPSR